MATEQSILLVNPPVNRLCGVAQNYYPLGLGYLAAVVNRNGPRARIYNAELETGKLPSASNQRRLDNHALFVKALGDDTHPVWREYRSVLESTQPSVVGFSCTSASIMPCLKMAAEAKRLCGSVTVFGGMHPTLLPEQTAKEAGVDYVVIGEAETSFPDLLDAIMTPGAPVNIPGGGYAHDGKWLLTAPGPLEHDLTRIPFPDRDCLLRSDEHAPFMGALATSRGCPYRCTFCSGRNIHQGHVRYRPIESVLDEVELLIGKYHQGVVTFYDDALITNRKRIVTLCEGMIRKNLRVKWRGFTRVDSVDKELLALMKESGCSFLGCGVESGSDNVLARIRKGYTRTQAIAGVKMIKDAGIPVTINLVVGFPFETRQDLDDTISLVKETKVPTNVNTLSPYPGSEVYDECRALGLIGESVDWTTISQHSRYNCFVHAMSPSDYRNRLDRLVALADRYASPPPTLSQHFAALKRLWKGEDHD